LKEREIAHKVGKEEDVEEKKKMQEIDEKIGKT